MAALGAFNGATLSIGGTTYSMTNWSESSDDRASIDTTIASATRKTETLGQAGVKTWSIELLYDVDTYDDLQALLIATTTTALILDIPGETADANPTGGATVNAKLKSLTINGAIDEAMTVSTTWSVA
jgi:hypothetical protein